MIFIFSILSLATSALAIITPDNSCGGVSGFTCNPNDPWGGACCSAGGWCGNTDTYCAAGCQPAFGTCKVDGPGGFTHHKEYTFTGNSLPEGLHASQYNVRDTVDNPNALYDHSFEQSNVAVSDGFLRLKVPGHQNTSPISCAEVATVEQNILYASVRVSAILTSEPGVVDGFFFYKNDCQEIDIEYLSDPSSLSNPPNQAAPPLQYTNQAVSCNRAENSYVNKAAPSDATTSVHEYRVDWLPEATVFYTDGVETARHTDNIPSIPGSWLFNIWTNGDPGFSVGPPVNDAFLNINKIVMYYNTTA